MRYLYERMHWLVLVLATIALVLIAVVSFTTTAHFADTEKWISHTHEVETIIARIRSNLFSSQDALIAESVTGDPSFHSLYTQSEADLAHDVSRVRGLTSDNQSQQSRLDSLEALIKSRDASLLNFGASASSGSSASSLATQNQDAERERFTAGRAPTAKALAVLDDMLAEERRLLALRNAASESTYLHARIALAAVYAVVVIVLFVYLRGLILELRNRERAEDAVRHLSGRLLQLQDAERRKIARDLHDSFGQTFAALKMNLDQVATANRSGSDRANDILADCEQLVEKCMIEARTLSHLLHPPLLDELGFVSAAKAYVEGYSARCHVEVNVDLPEDLARMPDEIELTLFRALQESLTNIHRHSDSPSVDIRLERRADGVNLTVRDYGKGIPADRLNSFANSTGAVGVGLAGMRERVRQLKGHLNLRAMHPGTLVTVVLPLTGGSAATAPGQRERPQKMGSAQITATDL
jgi:signal transduction histidine kinase